MNQMHENERMVQNRKNHPRYHTRFPPHPPRFVKNSLQVVGQSFAIAWQTLRKAAENFEILKAGSDELLLIYR